MEVFTIQENYLKNKNQIKTKSPVCKCEKIREKTTTPNVSLKTANALQMNLALNTHFYTSVLKAYSNCK